MNLQLYLLTFNSAHFGHRLLEDSEAIFRVHRLYSALFIEALALGQDQKFLELTLNGEILLSDSLFYYYGLYLPKPIGYPQLTSSQTPRQTTKMLKDISYIHEYEVDDFTQGGVSNRQELTDLMNETRDFYQIIDATRVHVGNDPYRVGTVFYNNEVSLAIIGSKHPLLEKLFQSLQYSGIGGKRSSGYGSFKLTIDELDEETSSRITIDSSSPVMLLNSAMAKDDELESILPEAKYLLEKSSGFTFTDKIESPVRKNDFYKFKIGSTFSKTFSGDLINVAPSDFPHPIWNYSIPLFYKLEVD